MASARVSSSLLVLLALALAPRPVHAGVEEAKKVFAEGVRLYQRGDYEGARRLFKQADAEHHAPAIVYNLALAEEKLGHVQAAVDAYDAYLGEVGDSADLSAAAAVATAQIKARSTRLRVESRPAGARIFVDGAPLAEPAPTTYLVGAGHHVVVAQGAGWRSEVDVEARGAGDVLPVVLEAELAPPAPPAVPAAPEAPVPEPAKAPAAPPDAPSRDDDHDTSFRWGAAFAFAPYYLLGTNTEPRNDNYRDARSVIAGPMGEVGLAVTPSMSLMFRGFVAIGPDGRPTWAFMGGPGLELHVGAFTFGAAFIGGQLETRAYDVRYGTDLVFGAMGQLELAVAKKKKGAWVVGLQPAFLSTELKADNTALILPFSFGYRSE